MHNTQNNVAWPALATVWMGGVVSVPSLVVGSTLAESLSFINVFWVSLLGFSFVVLCICLLSRLAVSRRATTVVLAAESFGSKGAEIVLGLVIGLSLLAWFGVQSSIAGKSFSQIMLQSTGVDVPVWLSSVFWGLLMVLTAVFGFRYLKWLNFFAVPLIILLLGYVMIVTFSEHSLSQVFEFQPIKDMSLLQAVGLTVGFLAIGIVISPDYNRFAHSQRDAVLGSILGIIPPSMCLMMIGAVLPIFYGSYDIVTIFAQMGFAFFALAILILATWTTNVVNAYSAGLALTNLFSLSDTRRPLVTLIAGLIGIALSVAGILDNFMTFINLLTFTIIPIAGVIIASYYLAPQTDVALVFNWRGVVAWGVGAMIMLNMDSPLSNLLGVGAAMSAYAIFARLFKVS